MRVLVAFMESNEDDWNVVRRCSSNELSLSVTIDASWLEDESDDESLSLAWIVRGKIGVD
jgi:hypothetical protein